MSDPDQPKPAIRKGRFQPGNQYGRGRPKGSGNKFGPNLRDKLLTAIERCGTKRARKAGTNSKVDGVEAFLETLIDNNAAASALISKLIPTEAPPPAFSGPGIILNVSTAAEGQTFCPGNEVLMPFDEAREVWRAYNAGPEAWTACLQMLEPKLTKVAFENLSRVPPFERAKLALDEEPLLRLARPEPTITPEIEAHSIKEEQLLAELTSLTNKLLIKYGLEPDLLSSSDGDDAA